MAERQPYGRRPTEGSGWGGPKPPREMDWREVRAYKEAIKTKPFTDDMIMARCEGLAQELKRGAGTEREAGSDTSLTQVRKFFNQLRLIQRRLEAGSAPAVIKPKLRVLQAQVAFAVARKHLSEGFKELFDASLERVIKEDGQSLSDFVTFFETLYAHFYYTVKKEGGKERHGGV